MDGLKRIFVGQFFEAAAHRILGGELCRNDDCDIELMSLRTAVEVKSSGFDSSYGMRLNLEQNDDYENKCSGFPYDHGWYAFFAYRNKRVLDSRKKSKRTTELARHKSKIAIHRYLSEATEWCFVTDLSVVRGWRTTLPLSTKSVPGHEGMPTFDVKCKHHLYPLTNGGLARELPKLVPDPENFGTLMGVIEADVKPELQLDLFGKVPAYRMRFPIRFVLPYPEIRRAKRLLDKRGFVLEASRVQIATRSTTAA